MKATDSEMSCTALWRLWIISEGSSSLTMSGRVHATVKIACVEDCAVRVVLVYLMCGSQTYTKCNSVLVPLRHNDMNHYVVHIVMPFVYQTIYRSYTC